MLNANFYLWTSFLLAIGFVSFYALPIALKFLRTSAQKTREEQADLGRQLNHVAKIKDQMQNSIRSLENSFDHAHNVVLQHIETSRKIFCSRKPFRPYSPSEKSLAKIAIFRNVKAKITEVREPTAKDIKDVLEKIWPL